MNDLQPSNRDVSVADAAEWSLQGSVTVIFSKTTSSGYASAVAAARKADRYVEGRNGPKLMHVASFGTSRAQLALAMLVTEQMRRSSTFQLFAGGKGIQDVWRITGVIECALVAGATEDPRAHCVVSVPEDRLDNRERPTPRMAFTFRIRDPDDEPPPPPRPDTFGLHKVGMRLFPCRYLRERGFQFQIDHPSSEADQIRAGAVRHGCDWCPHLRPESPSTALSPAEK